MSKELDKLHPSLFNYQECQRDAIQNGVLTSVVAISGIGVLYLGQKVLGRYVSQSPASHLAFALLGGVVIGFSVTMEQSNKCQQKWRLSEEIHRSNNKIEFQDRKH